MQRIYRKSLSFLMELFDLGPTVALTVLLLSASILLTGVIFFIKSAPPTKLVISAGPEGSINHTTALKYKESLARAGIHVTVLTSAGSLENLRRITDPKAGVDLALVQSGTEDENVALDELVTLGSLSYQPLFFFYRGPEIDRLSQMEGRTIAIGHEGSGARQLALKLLKLNKIHERVKLITLDGEAVKEALTSKRLDGAFLMGEEASVKVLRTLLNSEDIQLLSFKNAAAYARKVHILHRIDLPEGYIDFGKNIPPKTINLLAPMIELVATRDLHPALSDVVLDAATRIHGAPGIFRRRNEFPMKVEHTIPLSDDADRFYRSGKSFLYRYLPFWLASLINRIFVSFLPMLLVLIPAIRSVPMVFKWLGEVRIRSRYRALLRLEAKFKNERDPERLQEFNEQFEVIEKDIQQMQVRAVYADQFYLLRSHIDYVRRLMNARR